MNQENKISLHIPAEDLDAINAAIKTLQDKLMPHLVTLTKEERVGLSKMGDKNIAFIEKCKEYIEQNPQLVPQYLNLEEMKVDIEAVATLRMLLNPIGQISSALDDSMMLSGSEAYVAALAFYHYIQGATKMNIPGAKDINDELKKQFVKKPYKKNKDDNS